MKLKSDSNPTFAPATFTHQILFSQRCRVRIRVRVRLRLSHTVRAKFKARARVRYGPRLELAIWLA